MVAVDDVSKNCNVLIEVWSGSGHTETNTNFDPQCCETAILLTRDNKACSQFY